MYPLLKQSNLWVSQYETIIYGKYESVPTVVLHEITFNTSQWIFDDINIDIKNSNTSNILVRC